MGQESISRSHRVNMRRETPFTLPFTTRTYFNKSYIYRSSKIVMKLSSAALIYILISVTKLFTYTNGFGIVPHVHDIAVWSQQHQHVVTTVATSVAAKATSTLPSLQTVHVPDLFAIYQNALHTLPLQTQMATGAALAVAGDTAAQTLDKSRQYDPKRTISFAVFDACYRAVQHILYPPMKGYFHGQFLLPAITALFPQTIETTVNHNLLLSAAAEQALVSQLVVIPLLYYPIFFAVTGMVQGLSLEQTIERGLQSFVPLMKRNLLFWIPVQFGVFGWINDDALQISILIACGFIWTMILSAFAGAADTQQQSQQVQKATVPGTTTSIIDEQLEALMTPRIDTDRDTIASTSASSSYLSRDTATTTSSSYVTMYMSNSTVVTNEI